MKKPILSFLCFFIALTSFGQERSFKIQRLEAKDHVALIIGNSNYPDMPLSNPKNDAIDVAAAFEEMGFIVEKILDADKETMSMAIDRFSNKSKTARAAVFYFAGHGMQVNGENYLIPIGKTSATQITEESQVPYRAINAGEILTSMENQKVKFALVVLDACRNNPIKGSGRGKIKGLASIDAPAGSLIMYSTKAGEVANDGTGKNSPFTTAFLKHIKTPGLDVNLLPSRVTQTVLELTNGQQTPGSYIQLTQSFTFVPELTSEELKNMKDAQLGDLKGQYSELQKREDEMAKQKAEDEAILAKKQADIDKLEKQIADLKSRTGTTNEVEGDLDKMLTVVREREKQKKELEEMKRKVEEDRQRREKEIAELKKKELNSDIAKYNEIANSEFGQDMKQAAWNSILKKWGITLGSVTLGDEIRLRLKVLGSDIPLYLDDHRDGKRYTVILIGNQVWMAENLEFDAGKYSWGVEAKYGKLYDWETAEFVCPSGWHLPSLLDFETLLNNVGGSGSAAYQALIPSGSSGFSALFGGWRKKGYQYEDYEFYGAGVVACFWTSSLKRSGSAWFLRVSSHYWEASMLSDVKSCGFSVRCLKDN